MKRLVPTLSAVMGKMLGRSRSLVSDECPLLAVSGHSGLNSMKILANVRFRPEVAVRRKWLNVLNVLKVAVPV